MQTGPVFLMATSPRTGSTWLQRVLTAHGILVWGEFTILPIVWMLRRFKPPPVSDVGRDYDIHRFDKAGPNMWMAVLGPEAQHLVAGCKVCAETMFGPPALLRGYDRWGSKETMWDVPDIQALRQMYPEAPVIYLGRNFMDSYQSRHGRAFSLDTADEVSRTLTVIANKQEFCRRWAANTRQALEDANPHSIFLRYEDLLKSHEELERLMTWLGLRCLAPAEIVKRIGGVIGSTAAARIPLSDEDKQCIECYSSELMEINARYHAWQPQH